MSVRLNKIAKEVNVGVSSLVDYLRENGITVENDPNVKVSDEAYALLWKKFGKGQMPQRSEKPKPVEFAPASTTESEMPVEQAVRIETELEIHQPVIKGKIDLETLKKVEPETEKVSAKEESVSIPSQAEKQAGQLVVEQEVEISESPKEEPAPEKESLPEIPHQEEPKKEAEGSASVEVETLEVTSEKVPEEEKKAVLQEAAKEEAVPVSENAVSPAGQESFVEEPAKEEETPKKTEPEIFTFGQRKIESNIKVVSTIDLSSINQFTRPKKKTKQERLKEQEEKKRQEAAEREKRKAAAQQQQSSRPSQDGNASKENPVNADKKKKRNRIKDGKVRIESNDFNMGAMSAGNERGAGNRQDRGGKNRSKRPIVKAEVNEEDVSKQIKETLARLSAKPKKGAKYRKEKRDAVSQRMHEMEAEEQRESKIIKITEFVTVNDLATMMDVPVVQVISVCMNIGQMVSINQRLDAETINFVAEEFGFKTEYVSADVLQAIHVEEDSEEELVPRSPIITVMGHVDHGKTSLLDYIRNANVIAGEAGGITQHIGAYRVKLEDGREITFLDTPGHEAFTAMRARGAKITDIAIIIVAADDNVMPQTVEAINHASAANVPIVFAINKIDKPSADPERIKKELAEMNYLVEDWGGKYQSEDISAKKGLRVNELLEKVLLEAELLDLKANPNKNATGNIIESSLDKGRGYVATVLVQNGTLHIGDIVIAGVHYGRVKAMFNERGQKVEKAGPSEPVLILGLNGAPQAGDNFHVLNTEQEAREIAGKREQLQREQGLRTSKILTLSEIGRRIAVGNFKELNLIVKGDVDGSVEALSDSLIKLTTEHIQINVIHKAVGQISESDVTLASASDAIIVGFQVRPSLAARRQAERDGVDIRLYSIIYDAIEEIKAAMEGMLSPEIKEEIIGSAEVRDVFKISKVGSVAGSLVKEGKIRRTSKVRLIRDGIVIYTGELASLKRFKDDAKEVSAGMECGISIQNYNDIKVGDYIEAFEEHEVKQTL